MGITVKKCEESFVRYGDYFILGATVVKCPNPNAPDYGSLVMTADLFDGSDSNVGTMLWRSYDGGRSFREEGFIERSYQCDFNGSMIKSGYGGTVADEQAGVLVYFANDLYWERGNYNSIKKCRRLYYRLSFDNGKSFTDKHYIIHRGTDADGQPYDKDYFMHDVIYGRNFASIVGAMTLRGNDGALMVGMQTQIVDEKGELVEPAGFLFIKCGALKGYWNKDLLDYEWDFGEYAAVEPGESTRGVFEPAFARRRDGSILMIMRGSNMGYRDKIPGTKFYSISHDDGLTWSRPECLCYDDGSLMYSSSCIPKLLQHPNGKTYFVGVINDENPDGNLPRYPLCIAELDTEACKIKKESVTVIDTARPHHLEQAASTSNVVDYSNHCVYLDEDTGDVIVLAPYRPDLRKYECVLNKYTIQVD